MTSIVEHHWLRDVDQADVAETVTSKGQPPMPYDPTQCWRWCRDCDVKWRGPAECWNCGADVAHRPGVGVYVVGAGHYIAGPEPGVA